MTGYLKQGSFTSRALGSIDRSGVGSINTSAEKRGFGGALEFNGSINTLGAWINQLKSPNHGCFRGRVHQ